MKKKSILLLLLGFSFVLNAIEPQDYKSMTEHDRILLAVSYYEVFIKWKDDKTEKKFKEAESYLK